MCEREQEASQHRIYPYLLRKLPITRPNQVWCSDITYIPVKRGFLYLVAIMDWATRKVLSIAPSRAFAMPYQATGQCMFTCMRGVEALKYAGCQLLPFRQIALQSPVGNG
jgi:transposase InsO family protein